MRSQAVVEHSLERLRERIERREADEERTEQDLFEELERQLVDFRTDAFEDEEFMREDEFTCLGCHMILHRRRMANARRRLCDECAS